MTASTSNIYLSGEYASSNPTYHVEDAPWKCAQILRMVSDHGLRPRTVCEVGCGAGEILRLLQQAMPADAEFVGFEVSPQALALCRQRENERLRFEAMEAPPADRAPFDLLLCIDVVEHVEDYIGFVRRLRGRGVHKLFHFPLDLSVQSVLRSTPIMATRRRFGHVHYFTRQTALAALTDVGYEVLDWRYTPSGIDRATTPKQRLAKLPRQLLGLLSRELSVRVMGGHSLLVLAK